MFAAALGSLVAFHIFGGGFTVPNESGRFANASNYPLGAEFGFMANAHEIIELDESVNEQKRFLRVDLIPPFTIKLYDAWNIERNAIVISNQGTRGIRRYIFIRRWDGKVGRLNFSAPFNAPRSYLSRATPAIYKPNIWVAPWQKQTDTASMRTRYRDIEFNSTQCQYGQFRGDRRIRRLLRAVSFQVVSYPQALK